MNDNKILDMKKNLLKIVCIITIALVGFNNGFAQDSTRSSSILPPPLFTGNDGFRQWSIGLHAGTLMPFSAYGGKTAFSNGLSKLEYGGYLSALGGC
jgi:hypothetical protein